jgi:hypothetical protein
MALLGFSVLKDKLQDRSKCQTIRLPRKQPFKVGEKVYIYWHLRQKDCEKLGEGIIQTIQRKRVTEFTNQDAILDGFEGGQLGSALWYCANALRKMHPETNEFSQFDIITWKWL